MSGPLRPLGFESESYVTNQEDTDPGKQRSPAGDELGKGKLSLYHRITSTWSQL